MERQTFVDFNEAGTDCMAAASAGAYANHSGEYADHLQLDHASSSSLGYYRPGVLPCAQPTVLKH